MLALVLTPVVLTPVVRIVLMLVPLVLPLATRPLAPGVGVWAAVGGLDQPAVCRGVIVGREVAAWAETDEGKVLGLALNSHWGTPCDRPAVPREGPVAGWMR